MGNVHLHLISVATSPLQLLIDLSYKISQHYGTIGSPEKPLSENGTEPECTAGHECRLRLTADASTHFEPPSRFIGLVAYRAYWKYVVLGYLHNLPAETQDISIRDISESTGVEPYDIVR